MHKNLITPLLFLCTLYLVFQKSSQPGPKMEDQEISKSNWLVGNNHTDTIGRQLANPIVVKVTANKRASLSDYGLLYQGSGCNEIIQITEYWKNGTKQLPMVSSGDVGQQTLSFCC